MKTVQILIMNQSLKVQTYQLPTKKVFHTLSTKKKSKHKNTSNPNDNYYYNQSLISDFKNGEDATAFYPHGSEDFVIPARITMIIDCDEGWVGFCSEGKWLRIAFSILKRTVARN